MVAWIQQHAATLLGLTQDAASTNWNIPFGVAGMIGTGLVGAIVFMFKIILDNNAKCEKREEELRKEMEKYRRRFFALANLVAQKMDTPIADVMRTVRADDDADDVDESEND